MQRKLTAILSADVAGYSGLMEADEAGTLARLKANRSAVFDPEVAAHGGRIFKLMGDGALVEFASVVAAVNCALAIQAATAEAETGDAKSIRYRIGINLGEVIVEGDDIYGEGVNVASRIQALAPVGGVALSKMVCDNVAGKMSCTFEDMGEHSVKNIARPVHVFVVRSTGEEEARNRNVEDRAKLSICVLPFANMSGDVEQDYFSDGVSEDIITDLSKISALGVIARNTSFQFKGKNVDVPQVARQLKVSHILEGSVRKAGGRVRITAQLIDGRSGEHVWAERYDRDLNDIFALQDEISEAIVKALKLKLLPAEKQAIESRGTESVEAYNLFLMARKLASSSQSMAHGYEPVIRLCRAAIKIDPDYAQAWAMIATNQAMRTTFIGGAIDDGLEAAERAIAIDPSLGIAHAARARALMNLAKFDEAGKEIETALRLDPESSEVNNWAGIFCIFEGRFKDAVPYFEKGAAPQDANFWTVRLHMFVLKLSGDRDAARRVAERALSTAQAALAREPDNGTAMGSMAEALALLNDRDRVKELVHLGTLLDPGNRIMLTGFVYALIDVGDVEAALDVLEEALNIVTKWHLSVILAVPPPPELASHPRYKALMAAARARFAAEKAKTASSAGLNSNPGPPSP